MNQETFTRLVEERCARIRLVLAAKAKEYGRSDRLHNFKRAADFLRSTPESACFGFAMKHFTSIADLVDDVQVGVRPHPDMVIEKIGDAINYLILLEALLVEREEQDIVDRGKSFWATEDSKNVTVKVSTVPPKPNTRRSR